MNALLIGSFVWAQVLIPGKTPVQQFGINDKGETVVTNSDNSSGIYRHGTFTPLPPPPAQAEPVIVDRLRGILKPEIDRGLVSVLGTAATPIVRIADRALWLDMRCLEVADEAEFTAQWSAFGR